MPILIDEQKTVIVQGITGREGRARAKLMREYGTQVVGGVTPGKGGQEVLGLPVFNTVKEAADTLGPIDISVLFVPAHLVRPAAIEAIEAGVKLVVLVADRVPVWDAMAIADAAEKHDANFVGPNTLGIISPGRAVVGMIGGRAESARAWFKPANPKGVGIISRSGGMSSSTGYYLGQEGIRLTTICHVGGDAVLGLRIPDVALMFQDDPDTEAIVIFGEIGSSQEEDLADLMQTGRVTKPVIAYIGGKAAKEGTRFSHAGAIIEGGKGTHAGKVAALTEAGATVVDSFGELPEATATILRKLGSTSLMTDTERKAVWTTAVTDIRPNRVAVRGYDIADLMGRVSFGAAVYLILTGELPDDATGRLLDAILVSSIDHGATPPSCLAARTVASTGASLSQSVAAGIASINKHHGGAIQDCANALTTLITDAEHNNQSIDEAATALVASIKSTGSRISGFGHRVHRKDPRTARLFELAAEAGLDPTVVNSNATGGRAHGTGGGAQKTGGRAFQPACAPHIAAARAVERAFAAIGKPLPINVDGAIGAILADLGIDPNVFNGFFMIARTPGLVAHVTEEQTREKPMRRIDPVNHAYDGPPPRSLNTTD